jgi:hypothetical protein
MTPDLDALERAALAATESRALTTDEAIVLTAAKSPAFLLALVREVRELRERCANLAGQLRTHPWREGDPT